MITKRNKTTQFKCGSLILGGNNNIYIQSMTTTKTKDVDSTVKQIKELEQAGCQIIRVAVLDEIDANSIKEIKKQINIPLVADIHFDYRLALIAIENGVDKIRINPGNIVNKNHIKQIVVACKAKGIGIRIGLNSGSLPNALPATAENFIRVMKKEVEMLEEFGFTDICLSLKATSVLTTIECYELAAKTFKYPLHIGVTEAGTLIGGTVKSSSALSVLLLKGIGNTIRVSLTENPVLEIKVAKEILKCLGLKKDGVDFVSCPTCGRLEYDMEEIAKRVESFCDTLNKKIKVAVMGCTVNGPGEARDSDIGICGNKDSVLIFKKGKVFKKVKPENAYGELTSIISNDF